MSNAEGPPPSINDWEDEDFEPSEQEVAEKLTALWKQDIPAEVRYGGDVISKDDYLEKMSRKAGEAAAQEAASGEISRRIKDEWEKNEGPMATGNFLGAFYVDGAERFVQEGAVHVHNDKPWTLNALYNGAWTRMQEKFPEEIVTATACALSGSSPYGGLSREYERKEFGDAFKKMCRYLHDEEGVPWRMLFAI